MYMEDSCNSCQEASITFSKKDMCNNHLAIYRCIVVVQKRSVIPTFFSTTAYAAIPYFGT